MIRIDGKYKPAVPRKTLLAMAGVMWCGVGIMLTSMAFHWLKAYEGSAWYFAVPGIIAALVIHHFGFLRIVDKNLGRISGLPGKPCVFSFISLKSYFIIVIMVTLGITLRHSPIPKHWLSVIYLGIGGSLFLSSIRYFRYLLFVPDKKANPEAGNSKKTLTLTLFALCSAVSSGQVIHGTILEAGTKNPVSYATIFFNGTFEGTSSDLNGQFTLDVSLHPNMPVTVTAVGYYSETITGYTPGKALTISLRPKIFEIREVEVRGKSLEKKRRSNLNLFRMMFLGSTDNASDCKIVNEEDLTFNYHSDKDTIKAFAMKPLRIENRALGYNITYFLDKFEIYRESKRFFFSGSMLFNQDIVFEKQSKTSFERKRRQAYFGSRMHFFRMLWSDPVHSDYYITNFNEEILPLVKMVKQEPDGRKYLENNGDLIITYFRKWSRMSFLKPKVAFDKTGYFDPTAVEWEGELARQRIADWLPYEYVP